MKTRWFRRIFAILIVSALLSAAGCSGQSSTPSPSGATDEFTPAPVTEAKKAKITVLTYEPADAYTATIKQINDSLAAAGQSVEFDVQYLKYEENNSTIFFDKVKADLSSGNATADAFLFSFVESEELFDDGLTMDVTELVPQNAPVYYSKYKDLFPDRLTGIPTGITNKPLWFKMALMVRQDFASEGAGIDTVEGLFRFMDDTIVKPKKPYVVLAFESDLVTQWALEKGYYSLGLYGVDGNLFCSVNDSSFTPVPLESIPGFADFILEMKRFRQAGALKYQFESLGGKECIAYVSNLGQYYVTSPYLSVPVAKGEFSIQLLSPDMPAYFFEPLYINELIVPAVCPKDRAAEIIRFVEWMYTSQDNYDSIIYGRKGTDFDDANGRYVPLLDGKPLQGTGLKQVDQLFFAWPGAQNIYNFDYFRLPSSVPANIEAIVADGLKQNRRFALSAYIRTDRNQLGKVMKTSDEIKAICQQRNDILYALIQASSSDVTKESIAKDLESLGALKTDWLCDQYAAIIKTFVDNKQ